MSKCRDMFLKPFPIIYFWWIIYSFSFTFIYNWFNIWICFWIHLKFFLNYGAVTAYWKHFLSVFFVFTAAFFFINPVWRINIWTTTSKMYLMTFAIHKSNWITSKLLFPLVFISVICLLSRPIQSISTDSAYFLDPNKSLFVIVVLLLRYFGIVVFWYVIVVFHYCGIKQIIMKIIIITIIIIMIIIVKILIIIIIIIIIITMMIIMIIIMKNKVTSSHWYF